MGLELEFVNEKILGCLFFDENAYFTAIQMQRYCLEFRNRSETNAAFRVFFFRLFRGLLKILQRWQISL